MTPNINDLFAAVSFQRIYDLLQNQLKQMVDKVTIVSNDAEFIHNINDCINSDLISERIEGIDLDELLIRLGD